MKKTLLTSVVLCLSAIPALASGISLDEARGIALEKEPGEIVETDNKGTVYEFEIKKDNGMVMEIEVDASTGAIIEHKVDQLGPNVEFPDNALSHGDAKEIAEKHVDDSVEGRKSAKARVVKRILHGEVFAYEIDVTKSQHTYEVVVDALSGAVLSFQGDN